MASFVTDSPIPRAAGARVFVFHAAIVAAAVAGFLTLSGIWLHIKPSSAIAAALIVSGDDTTSGGIRAVPPRMVHRFQDAPPRSPDRLPTRHTQDRMVHVRFASVASTQAGAERPQVIFDRAVADFLNGRIAESVAAFDDLARLAPGSVAELWQRGIALYYAGRYKECREQFEMHRTVNPNDVENAAWHYLCVARGESPDAARASLLPVGRDSRVPMRQIYELFRGRATSDDVLAAAGRDPASEFYAHLYLGLYFEALGDKARTQTHITLAAADKYARVGGYMHGVARVHLGILQQQQPR
jgi:lipoprotein NlpI